MAGFCALGCLSVKKDKNLCVIVDNPSSFMDNYMVIHRNPVENPIVIHREKRKIIKKNQICRKMEGFDKDFCRRRKNVPDGLWGQMLLSTKILWKAYKSVDKVVDCVDNCG